MHRRSLIFPHQRCKEVSGLKRPTQSCEGRVVDDRRGGVPPFSGWFRKFDPTPATAEAGLIGEFPRLGQFPHAHQSDMNAAGGHAFAFPIETIPYRLLGVDVTGFERGDFFPIGERDRPECLGVVSDGNGFADLPLGHDFHFSLANLFFQGMKAGGKQKKRLMGKRESGATFMNAAFAEENRLAAGCKCITDDLPFFECDGRGQGGRLEGENSRFQPRSPAVTDV